MNGVAQAERPEVQRPLTGMPDGAHSWQVPGYREPTHEWTSVSLPLEEGP